MLQEDLPDDTPKVSAREGSLPGSVVCPGSALRLSRRSILGLVKQFDDFLGRRFLEFLPLALQSLGEAHGSILHLFVRFLRPTDQEEVFAARETMLPILVVKAHAKETNDLTILTPGFTIVIAGHRASSLWDE
jgi:hypothetical protein